MQIPAGKTHCAPFALLLHAEGHRPPILRLPLGVQAGQGVPMPSWHAREVYKVVLQWLLLHVLHQHETSNHLILCYEYYTIKFTKYFDLLCLLHHYQIIYICLGAEMLLFSKWWLHPTRYNLDYQHFQHPQQLTWNWMPLNAMPAWHDSKCCAIARATLHPEHPKTQIP